MPVPSAICLAGKNSEWNVVIRFKNGNSYHHKQGPFNKATAQSLYHRISQTKKVHLRFWVLEGKKQ